MPNSKKPKSTERRSEEPTTLAEILAVLGPGVVRLLSAPEGADMPLVDVVIHDAIDPLTPARGTLVLAVGMGPGRELSQLMERVAEEGGALVIKASPAHDSGFAAEAELSGATLLAVAHGAAWMQIAALLRSAMNLDAVDRGGDELGGAAAGDLFSVANAISALVDAPVTIEDPQSRVIAYSARQEEADDARMLTILGRQVPDAYYRKLQEDGVFRRLFRDKAPLYLDDIGPGVLPRLAVAVKAGDELLGSIWAAVKDKPSQDRIDDFAEVASFVAIHLLRHRLASDVQRGLTTDLVSVILAGGSLAADAASRLGLAGDGFRVLAVGMREGDAIDNEQVLLRCWDTLSLHLSAVHRRAASALIGGVVYAIIPGPADKDASRRLARQAADGYVARLPRAVQEGGLLVAIGGQAERLSDVPRSRLDADRVLLALRQSNIEAPQRIGEIEDMRMQVMLQRLAEMAAEEPVSIEGPLAVLIDMDAAQNSQLVATLRAYLDAFGDVPVAARSLGIHHNTLRYRLQKLQQVPGLDLHDAEQRLALQLQLRMLNANPSQS